jgi:hypothetical protein
MVKLPKGDHLCKWSRYNYQLYLLVFGTIQLEMIHSEAKLADPLTEHFFGHQIF